MARRLGMEYILPQIHPHPSGTLGAGIKFLLAEVCDVSETFCHVINVSRVITGKTTKDMRYSRTMPQSIDVADGEYHTYASSGGVYVSRYSSLVLPCYVSPCTLHIRSDSLIPLFR